MIRSGTGYQSMRIGLSEVVAVEDVWGDIPGPLTQEEEEQISGAVGERQREYRTVRHCARAALRSLGGSVVPLPRGPNGCPRWPSGFVGSLTHCAGYGCAAVARTSDVQAIGIDAELDDALPEGVIDLISTAAERAHLDDLTRSSPDTNWDRALFSAKESFYKLWSAFTGGIWLGFDAASVRFDPVAERFAVRMVARDLRIGGDQLKALDGAYGIDGGVIRTAVWLSAG